MAWFSIPSLFCKYVIDFGILAETRITLIFSFILDTSEMVKSDTSFFVESNVPSKSEHNIL